MKTTVTVMGDTWDTIAYRVYGDVRRAQNLMETRKNLPLLDIEVFPAGTVIATPEIHDTAVDDDLPEWRR